MKRGLTGPSLRLYKLFKYLVHARAGQAADQAGEYGFRRDGPAADPDRQEYAKDSYDCRNVFVVDICQPLFYNIANA